MSERRTFLKEGLGMLGALVLGLGSPADAGPRARDTSPTLAQDWELQQECEGLAIDVGRAEAGDRASISMIQGLDLRPFAQCGKDILDRIKRIKTRASTSTPPPQQDSGRTTFSFGQKQ